MRYAILVTTALLIGGGTALAQSPCTNHLLNDDYGVQASGTRPSTPGPLTPEEQFIGVAMGHFDGLGGYTQVATTNGSISGVTSGIVGTGSYVVNSDCTGIVTFLNAGQTFATQYAIVVVGQGAEVKGVTTTPRAMIVTVWRKK